MGRREQGCLTVHRTFAAAGALLIVVACSPGPRVQVDVSRGEPATALRFNLRSSDSALAPAPIEMIEVLDGARPGNRAAGGATRWTLAHKPGTPPLQLPTAVLYGVAPPAYVASGAAPPLTPGPYVVRVRAGGIWTQESFSVTQANTIEAGGVHAAARTPLDRTWLLVRLGEQEIPLRPRGNGASVPATEPGAAQPTLRFTSDPAGALSAGTGALGAGGRSFCNSYGTAYIQGPGDQLRFRGFESTLVGCDGPDSLETRFFRALAATQRFVIDSATSPAKLHLIAADGSRLTFVEKD